MKVLSWVDYTILMVMFKYNSPNPLPSDRGRQRKQKGNIREANRWKRLRKGEEREVSIDKSITIKT